LRILGPWRDWLAEPLSRDHLVHLYRDRGSLVEALALYAGAGLGKGESVVMIAERDHAEAVRERLGADGFETADLERWGQLRVLDAADVLDELITDGHPDLNQLRLISSALIADARVASRSGRIRLYGEMVNLLWRQGRADVALELEGLWNGIIVASAVPLFCAYQVEEDRSLPAGLCEAHTHVVPATACA
jgi:MEDS: MEthanogen/methylotroph, DcmR Sensory domain